MFVLVLNQNNLVQDGQNNKLVYRFPNSVNLKDKYIAVSSISMYYSWFNIATQYMNNYFTYTWTSAGTTTTYTINISDGLYNISDINNLIQYNCIQNGTYWTNTTSGNNVYPFEMIINANRYAVQLNTYLIPTSLPTGYTAPSNFAGWPTNTFNTIVTFPASFNIIVGYGAGFASNNNVSNGYTAPSPPAQNNYVAKSTAGTLSYLSNTSPQVQPNNNVLLSLSNINNPYSQPSSIIYSFNPNVNVGELISERPPNFMWNRLIDGFYNQLTLTLLGTNLSPLTINDPNMTILLTIRDHDELSGK